MKRGVLDSYCQALTRRMCEIWTRYSRKKAELARTGMLVVQRCELRAVARGFDGLRHRMVAAEIASQYKVCLRDIEVSSCLGHAFRVWQRYMQKWCMMQEYQVARDQHRVGALLMSVYREWWVRSRRLRKLGVVLRVVKMFNCHHLRMCLYAWKRCVRQKRVTLAVEAKTIVREQHLLCYILFRMWERRVSTLLMDFHVRVVAMEEDLLRYPTPIHRLYLTE